MDGELLAWRIIIVLNALIALGWAALMTEVAMHYWKQEASP